MRSDSVYLNILEIYLCLFLPSKFFPDFEKIYYQIFFLIVDADEFRLLLMPTNNTITSTAHTASHVLDSRLLPPVPVETTPKFE